MRQGRVWVELFAPFLSSSIPAASMIKMALKSARLGSFFIGARRR